MRTKPKILNYVALFLIAMSLSIPLQIMLLYGHSPLEVSAIAAKLAPLNWAILFLAPVCAWLVNRASPFLLGVAPTLTVIVVHNNWFVAEVGTDYSPLMAGMGTGVYLIAMGSLFARRELRELLMNPERRWWNTPARKKAEIPVLVGDMEKQYYATTFDISESGIFLPLGKDPSNALPNEMPLKVGSHCKLFFTLEKLRSFQCEAEVVRAASAAGHYPAGIGLRFLHLDREKRNALRKFIEGTLSGASMGNPGGNPGAPGSSSPMATAA